MRLLSCARVRARIRGAWGLAVLVAAAPAFAQQVPLGSVPGQNALQNRVGTSINLTCAGLGAAGVPLGGTSDQSDLFTRCTEMVLNANQILGTGPTMVGNTTSLGLSASGLNDAVLQLSNQSGGAVGPNGTQAAFVQAANLQQRFVALRDGVDGLDLAGLDLGPEMQNALALQSALDDAASGDAFTLPDGLGAFLTGKGNIGHFSGNSELLAFDFYSWGVTGGVDYRFMDALVAGFAFGWLGSRSDFTGSNGDLESNAYIPSLYASFTRDAFYADAIISYAYGDFDLTRNINYPSVSRTARGDTHANEISFSVGGGYEFDLAQVVEGLVAGPRLRYDFVHQWVDGFDESGARGLNLRYRDYEIEASVLAVGFDASYAISTSFGVLTPQLRFDWNHDFATDPERIRASFLADPQQLVFFVRPDTLDRDFFTLGVGLVATLPHGLSAFADWETLLDYRDVQNNTIRVGGRYEF